MAFAVGPVVDKFVYRNPSQKKKSMNKKKQRCQNFGPGPPDEIFWIRT